MGLFGHFGAVCAFAAFVCLLLCSITVPTFNTFYYMSAQISGATLKIGTFGACTYLNGAKQCTGTHLGYHISDIISSIVGSTESNASVDIQYGLTKALILVPIAAGMAFIAMLLGVAASLVSHILGSLFAFLTFIVTVVALGFELGISINARNRINSRFGSGTATLGNSTWLLVAATALMLIASVTICFGSLASRRNRHADREIAYDQPAMSEQPRRRFQLFRRH